MSSLFSQAQKTLWILTVGFYVGVSWFPSSNGLMYAWPWVLVWQVGLGIVALWGISQIGGGQHPRCYRLGMPWDGLVLGGLIFLGMNIITARFPQPALWQGWRVLVSILAFYGLHHWLHNETPQSPGPQSIGKDSLRLSLLHCQGYIGLGFIVFGLLCWVWLVAWPHHQLLAQLRDWNVPQCFDFNQIQLRLAFPLGHPNYVAGYLLLILPIFAILWRTTAQKWLWLMGIAGGLLALGLTSSRAGLIGLGLLGLSALIGVILSPQLSRFWRWGLPLTGFLGAVFLILINNRWQQTAIALFRGQAGGELAYRSITNTVGWRMGLDHWLTGAGLGSVPWFYQHYRPVWAGREAEILYELLSTPMQIFAEWGLPGLLGLLGLTLALVYQFWRWIQRPDKTATEIFTVSSLSSGLLAYGWFSLTDLQLDNLAITGLLILYGTLLLSYRPSPFPSLTMVGSRLGAYLCLALWGGFTLWLIPVLSAWYFSSQAFQAWEKQNYPQFEQSLQRAQQLAPWEPYYPEMLGWGLGEIALKTPDPQIRQTALPGAIAAFQKAIQLAPYREFAHNNLGVLQMVSNRPQPAATSFVQALQLIPARQGVFYQLGLSLLAQQQPSLALLSFSLECLRDPLFITSPLWQRPLLKPYYPLVLKQVLQDSDRLLKDQTLAPDLRIFLHQLRGGLYWWQGNLTAAQPEILQYGTSTAKALLTLTLQPQTPIAQFTDLPAATQAILTAWQNPNGEQRLQHVQRAWVLASQTLLGEQPQTQLLTSLAQAKTLPQWLIELAPAVPYRRQRIGHNLNSRHQEGPNPQDFFATMDNMPINLWFTDLFPSPKWNPPLDLALQPWREEVFRQVLPPPSR